MIKSKCIALSILLIFLMAAFTGSIFAGEKRTIVGLLTEDGLIVDEDGVIYEIGENEKFDAITEHSDIKIEVTGTVEEDDGGNKIIMVDSFKVLS